MIFHYFGVLKKQKHVLARRADGIWVVICLERLPFFYYEFSKLFKRSIPHNSKPSHLTINVDSYECE
jgi:hypothetical protein